MRKWLHIAVVGALVMGLGAGAAQAGEIDLLLEKLVEKGVLSAGEAQQIGTETKEQVKKEIAQGKSETLPSWLQTMKMKGDFRVRYQYEKRKGNNLNLGTTNERDRVRIRLRVGTEAKVNDQFKVNFGLATGSDNDGRSTNQSFQDAFAKKAIWIDYAYATYAPATWSTIMLGRMKNPIWEPTDMLWDTDINPDGGAFLFTHKFGTSLDGYLNTGIFVLGENAAASDPWMFAVQPGLKYALSADNALNLGLTYYGFKQYQGSIPSSDSRSQSSNSRNGRNGLLYNFNSLNPAMELSIKDPFRQVGVTLPLGLDIPYLSLFGEFIDNMSTGNSHTGYAGGMKIGHEKVADKGQWQAKYQYVMLGSDAFPDIFPDSDRYGGRTGIRSHEAILSYGLNKNVSIDMDYYMSMLTNARDDTATQLRTEHLLQADFNFKF